jgi:hypothetical protein
VSPVRLEATVRFPWRGGRHPCLDALIETSGEIIGVEAKRYEPFRLKPHKKHSEAYGRKVWGEKMGAYLSLLRGDSTRRFIRLDAAQLAKHALALRTAVQTGAAKGKRPVLMYLYAEPQGWPDGRAIPEEHLAEHQRELHDFTSLVREDEVTFRSCSYRELLAAWQSCNDARISAHANAVLARFDL